MPQPTEGTARGGPHALMAGWAVERWAAVIVLFALGLLIAIHLGFRSVNIAGIRASLG